MREESEQTIDKDIKVNPQLGQMIEKSQNEYANGKGMTTSELIKSLSDKDLK